MPIDQKRMSLRSMQQLATHSDRRYYGGMRVTPEATKRHLAVLARARDERIAARLARLRGRLPRAKDVVLGQFGAGRIWLFGSLVVGTPTEESDVDLAVEGLAPHLYFSALAELTTLFGAPVDLVRLEEAEETLRQHVATDGLEL